MWETVIGILAFIFVLGLIVLIHEGGHFFFARRANILCREYAFGMGPILVSKKKGETLYSIRAFPIGGFCAIAGEELEEDPFKGKTEIRLEIKDDKVVGFHFDVHNPLKKLYPVYNIISYDIYDKEETGYLFFEAEKDGVVTKFEVVPQAMMHDIRTSMQIAPYNRTLGAKTKTQRALVMFGGPLMNFVLAIVVFLIAGFCTTFPNYDSSKVGQTVENSPVYEVLEAGDEITKLAVGTYSSDISSWTDIQTFLKKVKDEGLEGNIEITFNRNNEELTKTIRPQYIVNTLVIASDITTDKVVIGVISQASDNMLDNSGLKLKDEILKINRTEITSWAQAQKIIADNVNGDTMEFVVLREGKELTVDVKPYSHETYEIGMGSSSIIYGSGTEVNYTKVSLGISPTYKFDFVQSLKHAFNQTISSFSMIFVTLGALFTSDDITIANLSGPVGIFSLAKSVANQGFLYILNLMGMLSVNVGLMNLLPIPALDGGRLVFLAYEAITKKKPSQKVETALITITMILLFGLMIFVTFNDVLRLFK